MKPLKSLHRHISPVYALCFIFLFLSHTAFAFGVLMTTPQQRAELDLHRNTPGQLPIPAMTHADKPGEQVIKLDGLVKRPNGPNSIWVNGHFKQEASVSGVFIDANKVVDSAIFLKLTPGSSPLFVKPGQRLNIDNGDVTEKYREKVQPAIKIVDHKSENDLDQHPADIMTDTD